MYKHIPFASFEGSLKTNENKCFLRMILRSELVLKDNLTTSNIIFLLKYLYITAVVVLNRAISYKKRFKSTNRDRFQKYHLTHESYFLFSDILYAPAIYYAAIKKEYK